MVQADEDVLIAHVPPIPNEVGNRRVGATALENICAERGLVHFHSFRLSWSPLLPFIGGSSLAELFTISYLGTTKRMPTPNRTTPAEAGVTVRRLFHISTWTSTRVP